MPLQLKMRRIDTAPLPATVRHRHPRRYLPAPKPIRYPMSEKTPLVKPHKGLTVTITLQLPQPMPTTTLNTLQ
jgi:hypothetical protein